MATDGAASGSQKKRGEDFPRDPSEETIPADTLILAQ